MVISLQNESRSSVSRTNSTDIDTQIKYHIEVLPRSKRNSDLRDFGSGTTDSTRPGRTEDLKMTRRSCDDPVLDNQ